MSRQLLGSAPVLYVKDLLASIDFYSDKLGFTRPEFWGDPPGFAMPDRDGMILMLSRQDDHSQIQPKENIWDVYFWVNDAEKLSKEFKAQGVEFTQELMLKELYGNKEFIIKDPDGYTLAFGQEETDGAFFAKD